MATETTQETYGLMAEFETPEALVEAARQAHREGYRRMDAYSPFPVDELTDALGIRQTILPYLIFLGGIAGALTGYGLQYFAFVLNYPYNIGGRPLHSWPTFIPITFELTILFAGLTAFFGILLLNGLPQPYHPVFNVPEFVEHGSRDRFYLAIESRDPRFSADGTRRFLENLHPTRISVINS